MLTFVHSEQTTEFGETTTQENSTKEEQETKNEEESIIELVGEEAENNNDAGKKLDCLQTDVKEGVTEPSTFCKDGPVLESSTPNPLSEEIDVKPPINEAPEKQQEPEAVGNMPPISKRPFTMFPSTQNVPIIRNQLKKEIIYYLAVPRYETVSTSRNLPQAFVEPSYIPQNSIYVYQGTGRDKFRRQNYLNEYKNNAGFGLASNKDSYRYTTVNLPSRLRTNDNNIYEYTVNNRYQHDLPNHPIDAAYVSNYPDRHTPAIFYEYNRENVYVPIRSNEHVYTNEFDGNSRAFLRHFYENGAISPVNYDYNVQGVVDDGRQSFYYPYGSNYDKIYGNNYRLPAVNNYVNGFYNENKYNEGDRQQYLKDYYYIHYVNN